MEAVAGWSARGAGLEGDAGSLLHAELARVAGRSHRPGCWGGSGIRDRRSPFAPSSISPSKSRLFSKATLCMCDNSWRSVSPLAFAFCVCERQR